MPVNIKSGETENEFISRCVGIEVDSGKPQDQAVAICYSYWRKDKMSKLKGQDKIIEKLKYNRDFRGINLTNFGINSEACWDNYIQVGTKMVNGREVPDCRGPVEMETQPTIDSTYPGQGPSTGSVELQECPPATQDVKLNLEGRQNAIDTAQYGPLNPNEPNEDYWKRKADMFGGSVEDAKKALCSNCVFFIQTKSVLDCIASAVGEGGGEPDPWESIDAGNIGYCEAFDFKCAGARTCDAWVAGGPIVD